MAPQGEGTFRVVDLKVGQSVMGSFDGTLSSDGRMARLELGSAMSAGEISGAYTLVLADPYNIEGKVTVKNMALDALILGALHLQTFNGHGRADGEIGVSGSLKRPESETIYKSSRPSFAGQIQTFVLAEISVSRSARR